MAIAATAAFLLSACSEVGFPAVHDMPAPRADTPLTPDQVKQATDDLISERDRLSSETQANGQPSATGSTAGNAAPGSQNKSSSAAQPAAAQPAASGATVTAGAYAKP